MAPKPREYRRLAGRRNLGWTRHSLWIGPDHLLKLSIRGYEEYYKRYYFKDIQALTVLRTDVATGFTVLLIALVLVFGAISLANQSLLLAAFTAGPLGLLLAVNLLLGPTCKFMIRTAVQTDRIEAIGRMGQAHKVIARLRPLLLEAQGGFTAEDEAAMAAQAAGAQPAPAQVQAETETSENPLENLVQSEPAPRIELPDEALPDAVKSEGAWEVEQFKTLWPGREGAGADAPAENHGPDARATEEAPPPLPPRSPGIGGNFRPEAPRASMAPPLPRARVALTAAAFPGAEPLFEEIRTPGCHFAFAVLALDGLHSLTELALHNMTLELVSLMLSFGIPLSLIVALACLPHRPIYSALRRILAGALVYFVVFTVAFSLWSKEESLGAGRPGGWAGIQARAAESVWDSPSHLAACMLSLVCSLLFAWLGFRALQALRAKRRPRPAVEAAATPLAPPEPANQES